MDYSAGKIYRIIAKDTAYFYIGSTIRTLDKRLQAHKSDAKTENAQHCHKYFNSINWQNTEIELLENFNCTTRNELLYKETEFIHKEINNPFCLNKQIPALTKQIKHDRIISKFIERSKIQQIKSQQVSAEIIIQFDAISQLN